MGYDTSHKMKIKWGCWWILWDCGPQFFTISPYPKKANKSQSPALRTKTLISLKQRNLNVEVAKVCRGQGPINSAGGGRGRVWDTIKLYSNHWTNTRYLICKLMVCQDDTSKPWTETSWKHQMTWTNCFNFQPGTTLSSLPIVGAQCINLSQRTQWHRHGVHLCRLGPRQPPPAAPQNCRNLEINCLMAKLLIQLRGCS